jgi:hypothetical protein
MPPRSLELPFKGRPIFRHDAVNVKREIRNRARGAVIAQSCPPSCVRRSRPPRNVRFVVLAPDVV